MKTLSETTLLWRIRAWALFLIFGLFMSGITAIPLRWEMDLLVEWFAPGNESAPIGSWLLQVQEGLRHVETAYPFMGLGTDWLAFGHIVIGLGFIGLLRDPLRNEWLVTWGILACVLVIPWALIFGGLRGIPLGWRLVDCSFGVGGLVPLLFIRSYVNKIKRRRDAGIVV